MIMSIVILSSFYVAGNGREGTGNMSHAAEGRGVLRRKRGMTQEIAARTGATKPQLQCKSSPNLAMLSGRSSKLTTPRPARHLSPITKATALAYVIFERPDLGRHIPGSQIFDYWKDPWGDKPEHYCGRSIGKIVSLLKLVA